MTSKHRNYILPTQILRSAGRLLAGFLPVFMAISTVFLLSACDNGDAIDDQPEATEYDNTVLLYYPWSGGVTHDDRSLYADFRSNIDSIESAIVRSGGTGKTRVLLFLSDNASTARLSWLRYNRGRVERQTIREYANLRFDRAATLQTILNDAAGPSPTPHYTIITGGHGTGWLPGDANPAGRIARRSYGGSSPTMRTDIAQIDSAIRQSVVRHVDCLCFDGCYMANVETAYALRNSVDYMIASTSEIMSIGLPYHLIWEQLSSAAPDYRAITDAFLRFYQSYTYPYGALSVVDCRQTVEAAALMRRLDAQLADAGIRPTDIAAQPLDGYTPHVFFDMEDYTTRASALLTTKGITPPDFTLLYKHLVVANACTPSLFTEYSSPSVFTISTNCGITISDPSINKVATQNKKWYDRS